jgi:hypothetical protein
MFEILSLIDEFIKKMKKKKGRNGCVWPDFFLTYKLLLV